MKMKPCTLVSCISLLHAFLLDVNFTLLSPVRMLLSHAGAPIDFKLVFRLENFYFAHSVQPVHLAAAGGHVGLVEDLLHNGELAWQCHRVQTVITPLLKMDFCVHKNLF